MEKTTPHIARVSSIKDGITFLELMCEEPKKDEGGKPHCGACGMFKGNKKSKIVAVHNDVNASPGDIVSWSLEEGAQIKASLILFLLPLVVFILATAIVTSLGMSLPLIFLISFLSLAMTLLGLKLILKNKTYYYITGIEEKNVNNDSNTSS